MSLAISSTLTSLPFTQFRKNRHFYLWYDGVWAVVLLAALLGMRAAGHEGLVRAWDPRLLLLYPVALYLVILNNAWIHCATHNSFPRPINRLVGELCGLVVLTRFASWEIIHQRHHKYSDDVEKDPHAVGASYWRFLWHMIVNVELQLQQQYYDTYGDTPENRRHEKIRALASFGTGAILVGCWYTLLGPILFFSLFLPATVVAILHLAHFNWCTHDASSPVGDFRPINMDHGFYWVGNRIWHGIYFHANHHKKANAFNPMKIDVGLPITDPRAEWEEFRRTGKVVS
ncbi:MAG: fatty acid desaturase [Polyangiaceae bacterium]